MSSIMNTLPGRGRTGMKRWGLLALLVLCVVWFNYSHSRSARRLEEERIGLAAVELPRVDRSALDKLRLLEIHNGIDDENPESHEHSRNWALDQPPAVAEIPEIEKPNPLLPVSRLDKVPAEILDEQVCGASKGHGCQFLVPAWLGEQETKAQQHLYQLGLLALATNRTLVLPNVSKSRLGTCYRHPFSFYYSPSSLSSLGIPTISQEDFLLWTLQRDPPPSAQVVSIVNAKPGVYPQGAVEIDSAADPFAPPSKPNRNLCLRSPRSKLDFNSFSPLAIYPPEGYHKSETGRLGFGQSTINTLLSTEVGTKASRRSSTIRSNNEDALPDVLAFNYEMRFPILTPESIVAFLPSSSSSTSDLSPPSEPPTTPLPFVHFPYAETWSLLADSISSHLSPFISIHWRTETLTPSNLSPCSESLLDKIFLLKLEYPSISNVYLATDYPIEQLDPSFATRTNEGVIGEGVAHSGTFAKTITEQHHKVMRKFLRGFETRSKRFEATRTGSNGKGLRLTTFAKEQNELSLDPNESNLPPTLLSQLINLTSTDLDLDPSNPISTMLDLGSLDSGLLGILDKLIVTKSQIFLTGVPGVGSSTNGACAKLSSFTNQLIGAREALVAQQREGAEGAEGDIELGEGKLWNTVSHWSLSGEEVD
ncbi:hypothetical protein JCM16303_000735 [Sporobolomyces ruberrimus]